MEEYVIQSTKTGNYLHEQDGGGVLALSWKRTHVGAKRFKSMPDAVEFAMNEDVSDYVVKNVLDLR